MSIHAAPLDHRAFVLFAALTHAAVGYALAVLAGRTPAVTVVLPDVDLLFQPGWPFPFVHRGLTNTPLFALVLVGALIWLRWRSPSTSRLAELSAGAAALGYGSHLAMDSLTRSGVPWLSPLLDGELRDRPRDSRRRTRAPHLGPLVPPWCSGAGG